MGFIYFWISKQFLFTLLFRVCYMPCFIIIIIIIIIIIVFPVALRPHAGHGLLILEVSRSRTTHHSR